jgi:hypothetical protein
MPQSLHNFEEKRHLRSSRIPCSQTPCALSLRGMGIIGTKTNLSRLTVKIFCLREAPCFQRLTLDASYAVGLSSFE